MRTPPKLTEEEFQRIYTDKKFRNAVAWAHVCCDTLHKPLYKKAMCYPKDWMVSEEQIAEARAELKRAKAKTISANKGNLVFVGMGMECDKGGGIINHRFRATFLNDKGRKCFVEYSYCDTEHAPDCLHCNFWITDYEVHKVEKYHPGFYAPVDLDFVLKQVNHGFGCSFEGVVIDNYDLGPDDHISSSKKTKEATK